MKDFKTLNLWPYKFKKWSIPLIIIGIAFLTAYQKGVKPEWVNVKVFALASTYLENRFLQIVQTNLMDEIGFVCLILGIGLLIFTQEQNEKLVFNEYRLKAFIIALKITLGIWLVSYLVLFGYIIFPISMLIFLIFLVVYYASFRYLKSELYFKN
jgi:hypothetical protein